MGKARFLKAIVVGAGLLAVTVASPAYAQRVSESRVAVQQNTPFATPTPAAQENKSPAIAGVLSWIIPGVGSFYAGNNKHGAIHLVVHVASFAMMIAGAATFLEDCTLSADPTCGDGGAGLYVGGLLVMLGNDVWSIFTAVHDANMANKGGSTGRVVGELYLSPEVKAVHSVQLVPTTTESDRRVGVQLLKFQY